MAPDRLKQIPSPQLRNSRELIEKFIGELHDRPSLVLKVACDIGAEIMEGLLSPNQDLNSVDLSKRFASSRTPVREALIVLEKEGLVSIVPRKRPRVSSIGIDELREIYRTRATLYQLIASEVVRNATDQELASLEEPLEAMRNAFKRSDPESFLFANIHFHELTATYSRNQTAKRILDTFTLKTFRFRRMSISQADRLERALEDHQRLVRAYWERSGNLAAALAHATHMDALATLERALQATDGDLKSSRR